MATRHAHQGISGVYAIVCIPTGEMYIGSAVDIDVRWQTHRRELREQRHGNRHLQSRFDTYGMEGLSFRVLDVVPADEDLLVKERLYIQANPGCLNVRHNTVAPQAGQLALPLNRPAQRAPRQTYFHDYLRVAAVLIGQLTPEMIDRYEAATKESS